MRQYYKANLVVVLAMAIHASCSDQPPRQGLHVEELGAGDLTIVVLHGGPGIRHNYLRPEWDRLATSARIVYYDQRGCGLSTPAGPHHWRQHITDLDYILDNVASDRQVVLAASSWGTTLALLYSLNHSTRIRALVLSGVPGWPDAAEIESGFRLLPRARKRMYAELQTKAVASRLILDSVVATTSNGFHPTLAPRIGTECTGAGDATFYSLRTVPPRMELRRIEIPVLIIRGLSARGAGGDSIASVLPNARVVSINGAGHDPWVDQPDRFFEVVQSFLNAH